MSRWDDLKREVKYGKTQAPDNEEAASGETTPDGRSGGGRRWIGWLVAGFVGLVVGIAAASDESSTDAVTETVTVAAAPAADSEPDADPEPEPEAEPEPEPEPEPVSPPEVEADTNCDYILDFEGDVAGNFVAGIEVTNVGETDARVRAVASWARLGSDPVEQEKTFTVRSGQTRDVQFSVQGSTADISAHQSAESRCEVRREVNAAG